MTLWFVIALLAEGLIVGVAMQVFGPQPDPMSSRETYGVAMVGSFVAGVIAWGFIDRPVGFVFAIVGAVALLYTRRRFVEHR